MRTGRAVKSPERQPAPEDVLPPPAISHLPDLHLPELQEPAGSSPAANPGVPSVLQKLQKWADYPSYGEPVQPSFFIPCKTPLSSTIHKNWTLPAQPQHDLTVPQLLAEQAARDRTVGLILDLSNHETLYEEDLPVGLEYEHIMLQSKVFPHPAAIDEVVKAARAFWSRQPHQYIAIHCAYGFNRTGFVVCSYLIQACGLSVDQALASFKAARPPGVRHASFIAELHSRYPAASSLSNPGMAGKALEHLAGCQETPELPALSSSPRAHHHVWQDEVSHAESSQKTSMTSQPLRDHSRTETPQDLRAATDNLGPGFRMDSSAVGVGVASVFAAEGQQLVTANGCQPQQHSCTNSTHSHLPSQLHDGLSLHDNAARLSKSPSQGTENDSLGLDERVIMKEFAASRLKGRSQRCMEPLLPEGDEG